MADHIVKFKEVPKGQKLQFLWDYYRVPALITACCALLIGIIIKTVFFAPKIDMNLLFTSKYQIASGEIDEIEKSLELIGDETKNYALTYVQYNPDQIDYNPQQFFSDSIKLNSELSMSESFVQIVDDQMFEYLKSEGLIATYKEMGIESDESIKLSLGALLENERYDKFYITLRPKDSSQIEDEEQSAWYESSVEFIKKVEKILAD